MHAATVKPHLSYLDSGVASGLTVLAMVYAFSDISGAHINPAVTIAFAAHGAFKWQRVPGYLLAQALGATAAALFAQLLTGPAAVQTIELGTTPLIGLLVETVTTLLLVTVIVHTSKRKGTVGPHSALAVGSTILVATLWAGPLTGASMNPARSFGPAFVGHHLHSFWIYVVGPICGSLLAVLVAFVLRGRPTQDERDSAEGES